MKQNKIPIFFFACHQYFFKKLISCCCCFLLLCVPVKLSAQLWNGNFGLPILNMDFGSGNSIPLPLNNSSYTYTGGCPKPGKYSIEHFLFGCAEGSWIMLVGDHTGDHDGNYMLVNGATTPGTVYIDTISGLCGSTTYQFSAWIANCLQKFACSGSPVLTNLTLSIETISGTILASYTTGDLPVSDSKVWKEYGVYYSTPLTPIPLVVRIKNISGGACGSVFIMDDITLKPAGPAIDVAINGENISTIDLCMGYTSSYTFSSTYSAGYSDPVLQWQQSEDTGKTWQDIPGAKTDTYILPHRNDNVILYHMGISERSNTGNTRCSVYSNEIYTNVHKLPDHVPLQKVLGCLNKELVLKSSPDFSTYQWNGPNGLQNLQPWLLLNNIQYSDAGLYTVKLTAGFGCFKQDSFQVNISPSTTIATKTLYNICEGTSINLTATGDGAYAWNPAIDLSNAAIANPIATPRDSTQYKVVLTNAYGCQDSAIVTINVFKKIVVSAGENKTILLGDSIVLDGSVKGTAVNYYWSSLGTITNSKLMQPVVSPTVETRYTLYAESTAGCGNASAAVTVNVYKDVFMPKAFTPNGDGKNDIYHVFTLDSYQLVSFTIFNRYGAKVFRTTNANIGWNGYLKGQPQETGAYTYYLVMKHVSGRTISKKGSILLIR